MWPYAWKGATSNKRRLFGPDGQRFAQDLFGCTITASGIDEIHTPDSSRYFYADGYEERQDGGEPQKQLSKEFVRQWLISNGFQGLEGQVVPEMSDAYIESVSQRYIELYENITGDRFIKADVANIHERIKDNVLDFLSSRS